MTLTLTTSLIAAIREGNTKRAVLLILLGADVNATLDDGDTVLQFAIHHSFDNVVEALLYHGADVDQTNQNGETALIVAAWCGEHEMVSLLLGYGADTSHVASDSGWTALMGAAVFCQTKTVELLLDSGADVNPADHMGRTALKWAICSGNGESEALLREHALTWTQGKHGNLRTLNNNTRKRAQAVILSLKRIGVIDDAIWEILAHCSR